MTEQRNRLCRPHSPHPNAHTEQEIKWIKYYHRRNPNISLGELYGKLREDKAYSRHPGSLYRVFVRLGFRKKAESTKEKSKHLGKYDTPTILGIKWQMDENLYLRYAIQARKRYNFKKMHSFCHKKCETRTIFLLVVTFT